MKFINIIMIDGKEVDLATLPEEERRKIVRKLNDTALRRIGYVPEETSETA